RPDRAENVLDVRKEAEYTNGHLSAAHNLPLSQLNAHMSELDADETYYLHCGSGYRSTIAASLLQARGFRKVVNVQDRVADILALENDPVTAGNQ
ncbi:MAG: rhodanese-like domain-containing protein, partial [Bacteroidota bacterium]